MEKCNPPALRSDPRGIVNQAVAGPAAALQRGFQVGNPETEVMDSGTVSFEVFRDRGAGLPGSEQFDHGAAHRHRNDRGAVGRLSRAGNRTEYLAVECQGPVEVGYRHPDVGQRWLRGQGH